MPRSGPKRRLAIAPGLLGEKELMAGIISSMDEGVMFIDHQGRIALANPALSRILGVELEEILGQEWEKIFLDEAANLDFARLIVEAVRDGECSQNKRVEYTTPEGEERELLATTTLMTRRHRDGTRLRGVLVVLHDVTQMVQLYRRERELLLASRQLAQQKMEALHRLAQALAHEIRNPITTIGGLVRRILNRSVDTEQQTRYLRCIMDCVQRLELILKEVYFYATLPTPTLQRLDLSQWLASVAQRWGPRAQEHNISISTSGLVASGEPLDAYIDKNLMDIAMDHLLDNAIKACPEKAVITLGLQRAPTPERALISVSDTGRGIPAAEMPYIFDPFYTTHARGTGMGLAIVQRIVMEHGGEVSASSIPGKGTTFIISLPLEPNQLPQQTHHHPSLR